MSIIELFGKKPKGSISEIIHDRMEIDDIQTLILNNSLREEAFRNPQLKQILLKQVDAYLLTILEEIKKDSTSENLPELTKKILESYFEYYFAEAMELEIASEKGRKIVSAIFELRLRNSCIGDLYKEKPVWEKYKEAVRKKAHEDMLSLSVEKCLEYDKLFADYFAYVYVGYNVPEAEAALKISKRPDQNHMVYTAMDYLAWNYAKQKSSAPSKLKNENSILSILLEYELHLREIRIIKHKIAPLLPIKMMEDRLDKGEFGKDGVISELDIFFAAQMSNRPSFLSTDMRQKLEEVLKKPDIRAAIEKRLEPIEEAICALLEDIIQKKRAITEDEKVQYSDYLGYYYQLSLDLHSDKNIVSRIVNASVDISSDSRRYNLADMEESPTTHYFEKQINEKKVFDRYCEAAVKTADRLRSDQPMTLEEFEQFDHIMSELSYRLSIAATDNAPILKTLEKRSEELHVLSETIALQIEKYIDSSNSGNRLPKYQAFEDVVLDYLSDVLKQSALEINENRAIAHFIRAAQKGILPQSVSKAVLQEVEARKSINNTADEANADPLDLYMKNVAETRLQQGRMPRECCEYIMKEAILERRLLAKYRGMVERAFEDFGDYELEKYQITNYLVAVMDQHFLFDQPTTGLHTNQMLKNTSRRLDEKEAEELLETILHEVTHAIQFDKIAKGQINREIYRILKEELLREEDDQFYKDNYCYMYLEIDARKNAYIKRFPVLTKIGLDLYQISTLKADDIDSFVFTSCQEQKQARIKTMKGKKEKVSTLFLELLNKKPELLTQHPVFQMEFEQIGDTVQRRSFIDRLKICKQALSQVTDKAEKQRMLSLCSEIVLTYGIDEMFPRTYARAVAVKVVYKSWSAERGGVPAKLFESLMDRVTGRV